MKENKMANTRTTEIPLMFCFDNNYVTPAAVAFYSLLEHANKDFSYKLFVFVNLTLILFPL